MKKFFKKPAFLITLAVVLIGTLAGVFLIRKNKAPAYDFIVAKRQNLTQEVSSTGRVKPAETIDLAFEKGGVINFVNAKVGDRVKAGQALVGLDSQELSNQLQQAEANLDIEKANLSELENGTRPEELKAAETTVTNAEKTLKDVQDNLANVKSKADADLRSIYDGELTESQAAVTSGRIALMTLTDIQFDHFTIQNTSNSALMNAKDDAIFILLGGHNAGWWNAEAISKSEGGAFGAVQKAITSPAYSNIDDAVSQALAGLQKVKQALDAIPITVDLISTQKTNIIT